VSLELVLNGGLLIGCFVGMEGVAWFTHKYVMHGFLWFVHRDHHRRDEPGFFERNDFFFLLFAAPGMALIYGGSLGGYWPGLVWMGSGIAFYGLCYLLVHDLFIHQRLSIFSKKATQPYLSALRRAHRLHHRHLDREEGECFGMLWVPRRLLGAEPR
jgi:beta-carotene 3-hydroxylase